MKERARQEAEPATARTFAGFPCVVWSKHAFIEWITVTPVFEEPFLVHARDVEARVVPGVPGSPASVEVFGILTFFGRAAIPSFGVVPGLWLADGRVRTGGRTRIVPQELDGSHVVAELLLGETVRASLVRLPCSALRVTEAPFPLGLFPHSPEPAARAAKNERLSLFEHATGGEPIELEIPVVGTREASGSRTRIRQKMDDGTEVRGWVATDSLEPLEGGGGRGYGIGGGGCGCGGGPPPTVRVATRPGTPVFARAGGSAWASVAIAFEWDAQEVDAEWLKLQGLWRMGLGETFTSRGPCDDPPAFVKRADVVSVEPEKGYRRTREILGL